MIVGGVGCRAGATAGEIEAAIADALGRAGLPNDSLDMIATSQMKRDEAGIADAARKRGISLVLVSAQALEAATTRIVTRSDAVLRLTGQISVAEAAALAAAGPSAQLLGPRIALGPATCALAVAAEMP